MMKKVQKILKNKKQVWDFPFPAKICGRNAKLGGVGNQALTIKLESTKDYPNMEIKGFLNFKNKEKFTKKEMELIDILFSEI